MINKNSKVIVIDWGTTNFRAFLLDSNNELISETAANIGLLSINDGNFARALASILEKWQPDYKAMPIIMAGMVGSAKGWHNVDYVNCPMSAGDLCHSLFNFQLPWGPEALIVPGVSYTSSIGKDVMRGEEIQIFGLASLLKAHQFEAVFPGTHSKHVVFEQGQILSFATYMTGELFSILDKHSILASEKADKHEFSSTAFYRGINDAQDGQLTHRLFLARTHMLFAQIQESEVADYISGMLIGHELQSKVGQKVAIVGSEHLNERYLLACKHMNIQATAYDGNDCFVAGVKEIVLNCRESS
ncbi:2-dehydro-3-deoxygalactonokinase [Agaribacter flavus]|uniref:2-dehydro-3-deoxygalactonokinase n=1 Tax=Agaribacter flavus TaxID=1902781 RepID=A0ABV7FP25_9ALTE